MPGEVIEEKSELLRQALIDARFFVTAITHAHGQSASARKVDEIQLTMARIVDLDPCSDVIVEDHACSVVR